MKEKITDNFWEDYKKGDEEQRKKSALQLGLPEDASWKDITDVTLKGKSKTAIKREGNQKEVAQNLEIKGGEFNLQETLDRIKKDRSYMKAMPDDEWNNLKAAIADKLKVNVTEIDTIGISNLNSSRFGVNLKNGNQLSVDMGEGIAEKPVNTVDKQFGETILKKIDDIYQKDGFEQAVLYIKSIAKQLIKLPNNQLAKRLNKYSEEALDNNKLDIAEVVMNLLKEFEYKELINK